MHYFIMFVFIVFAGCASKHKPAAGHPLDVVERLKTKQDSWLKELAAVADKNTGWLSLKDCDGTLWTGEAVYGGHPAQLVLAEYEAGEIHRRPKASGECYPKESRTSVSGDMLIGYVLGMYATKDLDALQRLQHYGEEHNWLMGLPLDEPRVTMSVPLRGLLSRAISKLGGDGNAAYSKIPLACFPVFSDYEYHVQTLSVLLEGDVTGGLSGPCFNIVKANAENYPGDALLKAAWASYDDGDMAAVTALITDDDYICPGYVRPISAYCTIHKLMAARTILKRFGE